MKEPSPKSQVVPPLRTMNAQSRRGWLRGWWRKNRGPKRSSWVWQLRSKMRLPYWLTDIWQTWSPCHIYLMSVELHSVIYNDSKVILLLVRRKNNNKKKHNTNQVLHIQPKETLCWCEGLELLMLAEPVHTTWEYSEYVDSMQHIFFSFC